MDSNMDCNKKFQDVLADRMNRFSLLLQNSCLDTKPYQREGVEWCLRNEFHPFSIEKVRGGIIADEMGLGKTIMMIGTMLCNRLERTLLVVPPILIAQWQKEIYRLCGHQVLVYYGKDKKRITKEIIQQARIVITSYSSIAVSKKKQELGLLHTIRWSRIVFDEAHHLRNKSTQVFLGCKHLSARIRWFITGTPIQNRSADLYNLYNALGLDSSYYKSVIHRHAIQQHFVLSRSKDKVGILLPEVSVETCVVHWSNPLEKTVSKEIHRLIQGNSSTTVNSIANAFVFGEGGRGRNAVLMALLRAKQTCIMTGLMKKPIQLFLENGNNQLKLKETFHDGFVSSVVESPSKLDAVIAKIVERKENGKGKIVFCHYRGEMDYLARMMRQKGFSVLLCDGRLVGSKRTKQLLEKVDILLLQIQTGCEGLNLQENYSEIYFVSPHWNPSMEDQAIARCHRIGQQNPVKVFKFQMDSFDEETKTVENYVCTVQDHKKKIREEIMNVGC